MSPAEPAAGEITRLLLAWHEGDQDAAGALMPLVYPMLRQIAERQVRREHQGHTLQPTALINEAYLRLSENRTLEWQNRLHFLAIAARLMRQILVDHARRSTSAKRGGRAQRVPLELAEDGASLNLEDILTVHHALETLARHDPRRARVVELRFFGGLTVEETARVLGLSQESVYVDWRFARAWLLKHLTESRTADG